MGFAEDALDDEGHLRSVDEVYEPGTSATIAVDGSCKTISKEGFDPWLQIDLLTHRNIGTVYVMGSLHSDTVGDIAGVDMLMFTIPNTNMIRCQDTLDGSGFYHCGSIARYLKLIKFEENTSFTICEIRIYTHTNLMALNPTASTN